MYDKTFKTGSFLPQNRDLVLVYLACATANPRGRQPRAAVTKSLDKTPGGKHPPPSLSPSPNNRNQRINCTRVNSAHIHPSHPSHPVHPSALQPASTSPTPATSACSISQLHNEWGCLPRVGYLRLTTEASGGGQGCAKTPGIAVSGVCAL